MGTAEGRGGGGPRFSADFGDIFEQDKKLIDAWHEILRKLFGPSPANDNSPKEPKEKA